MPNTVPNPAPATFALPANFLFLDETQTFENQRPSTSGVTGILVPVHHYPDLRKHFYDAMQHYVRPKPNQIGHVPEMHGNELPGGTPEEQLANVAAIVDLVVANQLRVYRVGYYITPYLQQEMCFDKLMLNTSFTSILHVLVDVLEQELIIPVMDGFDANVVKTFSSTLQGCDILHASGNGEMCSIVNSHHLIGAGSFVDSKYSIFTQVTDVVAYLRNITDLVDDGRPLSGFKKKLLPFAQKLTPVMQYEDLIAFSVHGKVQGPKHRARKATGKGPLSACYRVIPSDSGELVVAPSP